MDEACERVRLGPIAVAERRPQDRQSVPVMRLGGIPIEHGFRARGKGHQAVRQFRRVRPEDALPYGKCFEVASVGFPIVLILVEGGGFLFELSCEVKPLGLLI